MFPQLNITLENKNSYINSGNIFSKSLIIKNNLDKLWKVVLIVESEKTMKQYKKMFQYLHIQFENIENQSSLMNVIYGNSWLFLVYNHTLKDEIIKTEQCHYLSQEITKWETYSLNDVLKKLSDIWYEYSEYSHFWSYKKSWDILSVISFNGEFEYKISLWWDCVEEILKIKKNKENIISQETQKSIVIWWKESIFMNNSYNSSLASSNTHTSDTSNSLQKCFYTSDIFSILDWLDFSEFYDENITKLKNFCSFDFSWTRKNMLQNLELSSSNIETIDDLKELCQNNSNNNIYVYTKNSNTIQNFIKFNDLPPVHIHEITGNFLKSFTQTQWKTLTNIILCDDILWKIFIKKRINKNLSMDLDLLLKINPWDFVVHIDHWIGIFKGIIKKELPSSCNGTQKIIIKEFVEIHYKWEDKLFVPLTEVSRVNKFVGWDNPKLTWLNTTEWSRKLKKVDESIQIIAEELLEIYSQRKIGKSFAFLPNNMKESEFQARFPYSYTPDQNEVIQEILADMEQLQPMDRLLVWDVGFGKTEVAFNAIYRAFINKKQSVFIAPLVVLAYEHYEKALERFRWLGMNIAVVTRMESAKKINSVLRDLNSGKLDLVVWTHKLLSDTMSYKDLWLLIVDEEHKFGVTDKEKIKKLKTTIDILSMSATPIPRSLNMALSQIRQISIIKTPPQWRKDISTIISKFSERVILDGCEAEFKRWGQVYFVHNRVQTLVHFEKLLQWLFPEKKIIITHWQLPWNTLEKRIIDFKHKKYDILLTTTVIENGIDFPNVNTIFINEAQNFWISQIHQLRGRVWRSERLWHCYLLYKKENLWEETAKRLTTIANYSYLWAGFELAMKDLEIRWWWDLLWIKQSGQTSEIWVNLYLKMIEQKINELQQINNTKKSQSSKDNKSEEHTVKAPFQLSTKIDLPLNIWIPDTYFDSDLDKINFYREIESVNNISDLNALINDFKHEYNIEKIPIEMHTFFTLLKIKIKAQECNILSIKKSWAHYQVDFHNESTLDELKKFLLMDTEVKFAVINQKRLKTPIKNFTNTEKFLEYMLNLFMQQIGKRKITLKKS